jgi:CheY-like chemotaxis protein
MRLLRAWLGLHARSAPSWDTATQAAAVDADCGELCVLVVDDSSFNRRLASEMLWAWGVKALLAADGADAARLAKEVRLDLILMDLQMPVLDGRSATRQIRREERTLGRARVPILAYSVMPLSRAALRDDGFDGALDKPCDSLALRACLMTWCSSSGRIRIAPERAPRQGRQRELPARSGQVRHQRKPTHRP